MELAEMVYDLTESFPEKERYGLTSQIRRCVISISSNIAEGAGRDSVPQFQHFLSISIASANEFISQLILWFRLKPVAKHPLPFEGKVYLFHLRSQYLLMELTLKNSYYLPSKWTKITGETDYLLF